MKQFLVAVAAAVLLVGCGGGGSGSDTTTVQPFLVTARVPGVPFKVLVPGVQVKMDMEGGDTLQLEASQAGMRWSLTTDGNTFTADVNEDSAGWRATINSPKGGQVVLTATSADDPLQQATLTVHVNAQRYTAPAMQAGDTEHWQQTLTERGGMVTTSTLLATVTQVAADGSAHQSWADVSSGAPGALQAMQELDADGNLLATTDVAGVRCSFDPVRALLRFPLYYQSGWTAHWQRTCTDGRHETADAIVAVDDVASITVPQGTHTALRVHAQVALTKSNDPNLAGGSLGQAAYAKEITCWWSTSLRRFIQCTTATSYTGGAPSGYPATVARTLLSRP